MRSIYSIILHQLLEQTGSFLTRRHKVSDLSDNHIRYILYDNQSSLLFYL